MHPLKKFIHGLIPKPLIERYRGIKGRMEDERNAKRSSREVFREIYQSGAWKGDSASGLQSGLGSSDTRVVGAYQSAVAKFLTETFPEKPVLLDIGCGNFDVSRHFLPLVSAYHGVDLVPEVVEHNQAHYGNATTHFHCLDATVDPLPDGDVCLIRQVFQHLSNSQIQQILERTKNFPYLIITEHHPEDGPHIVPNVDKVHGGGIRLGKNSGVYLDKAPFNIPASKIRLLLEVEGHAFEGGIPSGVIRSYLVER